MNGYASSTEVAVLLPLKPETIENKVRAAIVEGPKPSLEATGNPLLPTKATWPRVETFSLDWVLAVLRSASLTPEQHIICAVALIPQMTQIADFARTSRKGDDNISYLRWFVNEYLTSKCPHALIVSDTLAKALYKMPNEHRAREVERLIACAERETELVRGRVRRAAAISKIPLAIDEAPTDKDALAKGGKTYILERTITVAKFELAAQKLHRKALRNISRYIRTGKETT